MDPKDCVIYTISPPIVSADEIARREKELEKATSEELGDKASELKSKYERLERGGFPTQAEVFKKEFDEVTSQISSLKKRVPKLASDERKAEYIKSINGQKLGLGDKEIWDEWLPEPYIWFTTGFKDFHHFLPPDEILDLIRELIDSEVFNQLFILTKAKSGEHAILVGWYQGDSYLMAQWNHVKEPVKTIQQVRAGLRAKKRLNWMDSVSWLSFVFGIVAVPYVTDWPKNMNFSHPPTLTGNWWLVPAIFFSLTAVYYPIKRVIREKFNFIF